ncbi:hypothetical protein MKW92_004821 [Papaver armeniacum]|nr:hypothetical protein MKW92_004821 [Papaver armeniacum]
MHINERVENSYFWVLPSDDTPILLHELKEFLEDIVYMRWIKIRESLIRALNSFERGNHVST